MTAGSQLQQARSERTLSLADVTRETKIQPWVLEALEADRLQDLMSPVYVKGFLTTYAKFLRLDPESLVAQLRWPQPEPQREDLPPPPPAVPFSLRLPPLPWLRRIGAAATLVAVILGLIVVNPLKRGRPSRSASPNVSAPKLASVTPVREPAQLPPLPTLTLLPTQPLELVADANSTTWVRILADGKLLSQERLPRGAHERWIARKRLELVIAKPSQVELTLNGHSITPFAIAHQGRLLITHYGVTKLPNDE